jgi:ABC-type nitrate/sulfonate/bicarbonate transport system substrate-binding protein
VTLLRPTSTPKTSASSQPETDVASVSRRQLLRGGAQAAVLLGTLGGLASILTACAPTSTSGNAPAATSAPAATAAPAATTAAPASATAAPAAAGATGALTPVSIQFCYLENVQFAGSYFATTKGYYKSAGLNVTMLPGGPSIAPEPIVISGQALVGVTHTAEAVSAIINGGDLQIIGATFQKNPTCIVSSAAKPIKTPTDMYGMKLGISDTNSPIWNSFVKANDLDVSKITVVTVGFDVTSLASGEIDGLMAFAANEPVILKLQGFQPYTLLLSDFKYPLMEDLYIARASDVSDPAKLKTLAALMKGESLGWSDVLKDPNAAADLAVNNFGKDLKLDIAQQQADATAQNDFVADGDTKAHGLFWMTDDKIAGTVASLALGDVAAKPSMFTNAVLAEVYKGGSTPA